MNDSEKFLGMKFDGDKPQMGLIPPSTLFEVAAVLTAGAKKYLPNNWRYVKNGRDRYMDAALRHIYQYQMGDKCDPETDLNHLAHAICCLMFILDSDKLGYTLGEKTDEVE